MKYLFALFLIIPFVFSCSHVYAPQEIIYDQTKIDDNLNKQDTLIESLIIPYRRTLEKSMNEVIANASMDLVKAKPESTLGNLLADATRFEVEFYTGKHIDFAIMNYGGIRVPSINQGAITLGNVYELMPFDNYLGYIKLNGLEVQALLNKIAEGGGWPVSGVHFKIENNQAVGIQIQGEDFDSQATYLVALSDYLAGGGDNLDMIPQDAFVNTNVLLRDAFIHYFKTKGTLNAQLEKRISYE